MKKNLNEDSSIRDPWVLEVQQWLNKTYGNHPNYGSVKENGKTGWDTIYGIIRAIQLELGVTDNPVDNFGEGTSAAWETKVTPNLAVGYSNGNVVKLIDAGFRCKGMGSGKFDNKYSEENIYGLLSLKEAAGFSSPNSTFSSMWAKALFDMSAFSLLPGGDAQIQAMQKWLNGNYYSYTGIMPCDGIYQRNTNQALIYALQAEEGLSPDEATGTYGETTTRLTPTLTIGDNNSFVPILKFGLLVNGFYDSDDFTTLFTSAVGEKVESFRRFMVLKPYSQIANVTVIKGLLSSAGDTNRSADGVDTSTQLSYNQIQTLVNNKVFFVGRYLTGTVGTGSEERDKFLTEAECSMLFGEDINIFPIYQDGGYYIEYFSRSQGYQDGVKAGTAATSLGIPKGVNIYFAVDIDILGDDIEGTVKEYFIGVNQGLKDYRYDIGVYGTRNVCSQMYKLGLAENSFVADMSTGFSGNLGFSMPRNWAFDQFIEFTMGTGDEAVGIDQVAISYKDQGFTYLESNNHSPRFLDFVEKVQKEADNYFPSASVSGKAKLVADYFRSNSYGNIIWEGVAGPIDWEFVKIVNNAIPESERVLDYIDPVSGMTIGGEHFFAAIAGYMFHGLPDYDKANLGDGCGWLGDFDTILIDYWNNKDSIGSVYSFGYDWIGGVADAGDGYFGRNDLIADIDAWNISYQVLKNNQSLFSFLASYLSNEELYNYRYTNFVATRFAATEKNILKGAQEALLTTQTEDFVLWSFRVGLLGYFGGANYLDADKDIEAKKELCKAFHDKILYLANEENK